MSLKRMTMLAATGVLAVSSIACNEPEKPAATTNSNASVATPATTRVEPKIIKQNEAAPDNSTLTVRQQENGDVVSVRKWNDGPVKKVTKRERSGETKQIRVLMRDGSVYRVDDRNAIEHALDWTGAQLAEAAKKSGRAMDAAAGAAEDAADEVGDKAEDAKDQAVKGAKEVGDKAEDVKDKAVEGAKKVGEAVKP
jgi:hypothetical protein